MFIELVDALRCLRPHDESWLVAAVERFEGRYIERGSLGCPICRAEYRIEHGAADFRAGDAGDVGDVGGVGDAGDVGDVGDVGDEGPIDDVLRVRALLDLSEPGGTIVLAGRSAALAAALEDEVDVNLLLLNPGDATVQRAGRSTLLTADRVPLARGSLRGAVIAADQATAGILSGVASALRVGGRLLAPVGAEMPLGMEELARDAWQWVAVKRDAVSAPVTLGLRR